MPWPPHAARKPCVEGRARLDSMHQGDCDKVKGVEHINRVDEVTQCEFTTCGERISECHPLPVLGHLLASSCLPIVMHCFHSDKSSHKVSHQVDVRMEGLGLEEFAKPSQRFCNNDVSAASKNGNVICSSAAPSTSHAGTLSSGHCYHRSVLVQDLNYQRPFHVLCMAAHAKEKRRKACRKADVPNTGALQAVYRGFLIGSASSLNRFVTRELQRKLWRPVRLRYQVNVDSRRWRASAVKSLVDAWLNVNRALELAGFDSQ